MPNFRRQFPQFIHRRVGLEARDAARALKEGEPIKMTRDAIEKFDFNDYFDNLTEVAPILTTTLVAAATCGAYKDRKVRGV